MKVEFETISKYLAPRRFISAVTRPAAPRALGDDEVTGWRLLGTAVVPIPAT
ncbi:MAG: hypothetical protein R2845_02370 [Thermomicrobiales bacterium]